MYAYIAPTTTREFTVYCTPCTVAVGTHVCIYCPHHHTWVHRVRCTMYGSCTWLTCMRTAPHQLPKKVTKKPSVNHIGSSNEPPTMSRKMYGGVVGVAFQWPWEVNSCQSGHCGCRTWRLPLAGISTCHVFVMWWQSCCCVRLRRRPTVVALGVP